MIDKNPTYEIIQPTDSYVTSLLDRMASEQAIDIDPTQATRAQRIQLALQAIRIDSGFSAAEIMLGRRIESSDPRDKALLSKMLFADDLEAFISSLPHDYSPQHTESETY